MNSCVLCVVMTLIFISSSIFHVANSNDCTKESCFPPTEHLETVHGASITANSTCGGNGNEEFCVKGNCLHQCNNADPSSSNYHGVNLTIDSVDDDTYWKSKNLDENVVLELNLGHSYFFVSITATFAVGYPAAMYFSKSDDHGATWQILAYFSSDCNKYFGMSTVQENDRDGFIVQCFRLDSANIELKASYQPWRDQDFAANIHRNYTLQQEFLATDFRMHLVKFEAPPQFDPSNSDARNFYFAVQDWNILGSCYCHGQSAECNTKETWKCNCLKNTTGENCQECLPLFNNRKYESGKVCTECECNNHSLRCEYDETKGHGVCQNCTGFTTGDTCDQCLPYHYEALLPIDHPDRCQACDCDLSGITGEPGSDRCNQTTGLCNCKLNVTGRTCGECKDKSWNLTKDNPYGCQECICEPAGTVGGSKVCDKKTGQCPCREHLVGLSCTECEHGFYGLTYDNPSPCKDCSCSAVGSVNITCDQTSGRCFCRDRFSGPNCTVLEAGFYIPGVPEVTYEAERTGPSAEYHDASSGITGILIDGTSDARSIVFSIDIPSTSVYTLVVRYQTSVEWKDVRITVMSMLSPFLSYSCNDNPPITNQSFVLTATVSPSSTAVSFGDSCLVKGPYSITLEFPSSTSARSRAGSSTEALIDSLVTLPSVRNVTYPKADNITLLRYEQAFSLSTWSQNQDEIQASLAPYFSSVFEGGKTCSCNDTGSNSSSCEENGGQCSCKPNVDGLSCDRCKPGFYDFTETGCKGCGCDPVGSNSTLCDPMTGQCQCKEGVIGLQCNQCKQNFYGFDSGTGCLPCLCDQQYSKILQCNNDGVCPCKPGVKFPKCRGCNDTSYNLTSQGCDACNCDIDGSESLTCDKQTGKCPCKTLAVGTTCDSCVRGFYYGLDEHHPTGCLKCQCSGKTVNCTSKSNMYESDVRTGRFDLNMAPDNINWTATRGIAYTVFGFIEGVYLDPVYVIELTSNTDEVPYFKAPPKFLGDKRTAYQHQLSFYLKQTDADNPLDTVQGDVILKGRWFAEDLVYKFDNMRPGEDYSLFSVYLREENWKIGNASGRNVSSYEMVMVLSELTELWIRAKWSNTTGSTTTIAFITMRLSKEFLNSSRVPSGARRTKSVELCDCPREFTGDSCQQCAEGYTRLVPNSGPYTTCVPCSCNGNSDRCDSNTGVCLDCKYNTTGDHCERCETGYYGNATSGSPDACKACSCYGGHNSCDLTIHGSFVCNCGVGYEGDQCQSCADGYFGVPTEPNGRCSSCACNQNSRTCNRTTGDCSEYCKNNSTGFNCEICKPQFFGDATTQNCQGCNCLVTGSHNNTCDRDTGSCPCFSNVVGRTCSQCKPNAWGYGNETGCKECNCDDAGSTTLQCDLFTGRCDCKVNVTGMQCDRCIDGRYGVSLGCVECDCNATYSNHSVCDPRNGQCQCKQSEAGGFYGGRQCTECRWDAVGAFPICAQCNETCYENWYKLIADERAKVVELSENVSRVLQTFNGSSVEVINQTLAELNTKLAEAEKIFNGSRFDTKTKEEKYKAINESLVQLKQDLDEANETLTEIMSYLVNVITPFDGTVTVSSTAPPVEANYSTIRKWAEQILGEVEANNRTAYQNYRRIMSLYEQIEAYNSTGTEAIEQVKESVKRLNSITEEINETRSILSEEFYDNVQDNDQKLEELTKDSQDISRLVNESSVMSAAARTMLDHARGNISEARSQADSNLNESRAVFNKSVEAQSKAYEAMNVSSQFKANSSDLLSQVEDAIAEVKQGIDNMAHARANLGNATAIADEVLGMTISVKEQTIHEISQDILSNEVDQALVNETLKNATAGLKIAEQAQRLAERAMTVSNITLEQVGEIERRIKEAHERREEARRLQSSTDQMVEAIRNITDEVEEEYSEAKSIGDDTLVLLNATIQDIDRSLKCFNESKQLAVDANGVANLAYRQAMNASKIHNESETILRDIEFRLNASYNTAMASYRSIVETYRNASSLYEEVKEAEDLLKSYISQRDEMNALKTAVARLETQLDSLNDDLERKLLEYESCNGGG